MESDALCQVCFVPCLHMTPHTQLIRCLGCGLYAHRYCYLPMADGLTFTCDACKSQIDGKCKFCLNKGLLKKIGKGYAHPICLLFNAGAIVTDFQELTFAEVEHQAFKKFRCIECDNVTSSVISCSSENCPKKSHLYCALKSYKADDGKGWRSCLQPLFQLKTYSELYQNLLSRAIRTRNSFLAGQMGIKKNIKTIEVATMISCEEHSLTIVDCVCRNFNEESTEWMYCERCCRWEHENCLQTNEKQQNNSKDPFVCNQCKEWASWIKQVSVYLPKKLPKMHIYDYIFLNTLVEKVRQHTPKELIEFLPTIPLLPGTVYAELFFKKQLLKKVRHKIDLAELKKNVDKLSNDTGQLYKYFLANRIQLELVWTFVQGSIFEPNKLVFPLELEQDCVDPIFVNKALDYLQKFDQQYTGGKTRIFENAKRVTKLQKIEEETSKKNKKKGKSKGGRPRKINTSIGPTEHSRGKVKIEASIEMKIESKPSQDQLMKMIKDALQYSIKCFSSNSPNKEQNLLLHYKQLHATMREPEVLSIIKQLPETLFTKSILLFDTAQLSAKFMEYISYMNHLSVNWKKLKGDNSWFRCDQFEEVYDLCRLGSALKDQMRNIEHNEIQKQLMQELHSRQCDKNFPSMFCFSYEHGYPKEQWTVVPQQLMNLKSINGLLKIKELNKEQLPRLAVAESVLKQLKSMELTYSNQETVTIKLKDIRSRHKQMYIEVVKVFEEFLRLYDKTEKLLIMFDVKYNKQDNLMRNFSKISIDKLVEKPDNQEALMCYFQELQNINLLIFSSQIQLLFKERVEAYFACLERKLEPFENEQVLSMVKNWMFRLKIELPKLSKMIDADRQLKRRFTFVQPNFSDLSAIQNLQKTLKTVSEQFKELPLPFRKNKIKLILEWINAYKLLINKLPLECILSEQDWVRLKSHDKPSYSLISKLYSVLCKMNFPEGEFKEKLKLMLKRWEQLKEKYTELMAPCDWGYSHGISAMNWESKIPLSSYQKFLQEANAMPLSLGIQIQECQIVVQKFIDNENASNFLLQDATNNANKVLGKKGYQKVKSLVQHYGATPISSPLVHKLISLLDTFKDPSKQDLQAEKSYKKIKQEGSWRNYTNVCQLIQFIEKKYRGKLNKEMVISELLKLIAPVQECLKEYSQQISHFNNREVPFTQAQFERLNSLSLKYSSSKCFHNILEDICWYLNTYKHLQRKSMYLDNCLKEKIRVQTTELEKIHQILDLLVPCFQDDQMKAIKSNLVSLKKLGQEIK